jgi:hypothetical protein
MLALPPPERCEALVSRRPDFFLAWPKDPGVSFVSVPEWPENLVPRRPG